MEVLFCHIRFLCKTVGTAREVFCRQWRNNKPYVLHAWYVDRSLGFLLWYVNFVLLIVVLMFMPTGIFGEKVTDKV